ncbi:MAG TPA: hypothetical protein VMA37_00990 [Acetobacteraceae bacterium]|nr:hypothetical protein [Acetobacteraceae bacterium]
MKLRDRQSGCRQGPAGGGIGKPMSRRGERRREHGHRRREAAANLPIEDDLVKAIVDSLVIAALRGRQRSQQAALMPGKGKAARTAELKPRAALPTHLVKRRSHGNGNIAEILPRAPGDIGLGGITLGAIN